VCGGACSLVSDIKKVPTDAVKISCNHHAAQMLDCEWIVSNAHYEYIKKHTGYMDIKWADTKGLKNIGYVGTTGVSFALFKLNADIVYIAGMDLYKTDYYWKETKPQGVKRPYKERVEFWELYKKSIGKHAARVKPISGPLVEIWNG